MGTLKLQSLCAKSQMSLILPSDSSFVIWARDIKENHKMARGGGMSRLGIVNYKISVFVSMVVIHNISIDYCHLIFHII